MICPPLPYEETGTYIHPVLFDSSIFQTYSPELESIRTSHSSIHTDTQDRVLMERASLSERLMCLSRFTLLQIWIVRRDLH
jgi:hypothetical protein